MPIFRLFGPFGDIEIPKYGWNSCLGAYSRGGCFALFVGDMIEKHFLLSVLLLGSIVSWGQEEDRPLNIIVILADDPGWAHVAE